MSSSHASYDEIDSPSAMRADAAEVGRALRLHRVDRRAEAADLPREMPEREIAIDEAAARIANALHLHLD